MADPGSTYQLLAQCTYLLEARSSRILAEVSQGHVRWRHSTARHHALCSELQTLTLVRRRIGRRLGDLSVRHGRLRAAARHYTGSDRPVGEVMAMLESSSGGNASGLDGEPKARSGPPMPVVNYLESILYDPQTQHMLDLQPEVADRVLTT